MKKEHFKLIPAVHLFLIKDGKILLLRRFNTGYEDGNYSVPAGHIDGEEKATSAMTREAKEEVGIDINEGQLRMAHVMHRKSDEERIDFFFEATQWQGEPKNMETNKCDDLSWFSIDQLPSNIIPYVKAGIENYRNKLSFSEFGWNER
ncbi:MAG: NUDIX domain-containing protein [Patescibacteria group bacterium]|jgi:ADP-ribose pyrophosphatase YjhB (NUDIX family)